jgi:hypothetical protein
MDTTTIIVSVLMVAIFVVRLSGSTTKSNIQKNVVTLQPLSEMKAW